jgi:hypothetical protein
MLEAGFGRAIDSRGRRGSGSRPEGGATTRKTACLVAISLLAGLGAGLALGLGQALATRLLGEGEARASGGTADSGNGMIAVTGDVGSGTSVLWLVDTEKKRLSVYRAPLGKALEWVGARNVEWDFKVEGFHDESPVSSEEMRRRWEQHALREPTAPAETGGAGTEPAKPGGGASGGR